ncbi:unnamed protein product [Danaus chrysippus]|uniref:(African queen) hypothetical protein n=1 Tax=Danaus chrysippus TaxID=151541 RepID=A0A8J2VQV1_9NEOP|nr:unnamed protein product [Danaus chrysippus]
MVIARRGDVTHSGRVETYRGEDIHRRELRMRRRYDDAVNTVWSRRCRTPPRTCTGSDPLEPPPHTRGATAVIHADRPAHVTPAHSHGTGGEGSPAHHTVGCDL